MSKTDRFSPRATARARKAFACAVGYRMDQAEAEASARAMRRAKRGERHARGAYLESLRLADLLDCGSPD